jgi:hypothetical protein
VLWCHGSLGPQAETDYLDGSKQSSTGRGNKDGTSILDHKPKRKRRLHNEQKEISRHRIKDSASPLRSPRIVINILVTQDRITMRQGIKILHQVREQKASKVIGGKSKEVY